MSEDSIVDVDAWEVLDSRGDPTVRVRIETAGGARGDFTVPSGASTGEHEAVERRDGGQRYGGKGVREAVDAVRTELAPVVEGRPVTAQGAVDEALVERDGTADLSTLGANAVLGLSGAVLHAAAASRDVQLYEHVGHLANLDERSVPLPMVNVLSGGHHAAGGIEVQDYLVIPEGADTYPEAIETVHDVRSAVRDRLVARGERPLVADEGGFAPALASVEAGFDLLDAAVRDAGYTPGESVTFAVDVAATHFYDPASETYELASLGRELDREGMVDLVVDLCTRYPIRSVEDPLGEDDWDGWALLAERLPGDVQLLGDDLLATNAARLDRAIEASAVTAALVKPNQAGTVTRTLDVLERARAAGVATVVSARSGETCDSTIADLAVGTDAGQLKVGSLARSERLAKYNRLLDVVHRSERELELATPFEQ